MHLLCWWEHGGPSQTEVWRSPGTGAPGFPPKQGQACPCPAGSTSPRRSRICLWSVQTGRDVNRAGYSRLMPCGVPSTPRRASRGHSPVTSGSQPETCACPEAATAEPTDGGLKPQHAAALLEAAGGRPSWAPGGRGVSGPARLWRGPLCGSSPPCGGPQTGCPPGRCPPETITEAHLRGHFSHEATLCGVSGGGTGVWGARLRLP